MAGRETIAGDQEVDRHAAPGSILKDERLRRDLTIDQVAQSLHLNRATIDSLEKNDFDALPPITFLRGYLRAYGQLLGLDADALVASLPNVDAETEAGPLPGWVGGAAAPRPSRPSPFREARILIGIGVALVVAIGAVGGGAWWFAQQGEPTPAVVEPAVEEGTNDSTEAQPVSEPAVPEQPVDVEAPASSTENIASTEVASDSELAGMIATRTEAARRGEAPVVTSSEPREPQPGDQTLALVFTGESWMEISDATGDRLLFGLLGEGEERLRGQPPFEVVVGDVNSVVIEFEGEPVDLDAYARGNVARFTLGES